MKISLFIFNPYSGIGGGDKTLYRFLNSVNFEKYNVTLITLSNIKKFSKKIKIIKLKSSSTFISFFQIFAGTKSIGFSLIFIQKL